MGRHQCFKVGLIESIVALQLVIGRKANMTVVLDHSFWRWEGRLLRDVGCKKAREKAKESENQKGLLLGFRSPQKVTGTSGRRRKYRQRGRKSTMRV